MSTQYKIGDIITFKGCQNDEFVIAEGDDISGFTIEVIKSTYRLNARYYYIKLNARTDTILLRPVTPPTFEERYNSIINADN
jgi:hypothetical protein